MNKTVEEVNQWLFESFAELECVSDMFPPNGCGTVEMLKNYRLMSPKSRDMAIANYQFLVNRVRQLTETLEFTQVHLASMENYSLVNGALYQIKRALEEE